MSTTPLYAVEPTVWDRAGRLSGILALLAAGECAPALVAAFVVRRADIPPEVELLEARVGEGGALLPRRFDRLFGRQRHEQGPRSPAPAQGMVTSPSLTGRPERPGSW